MNIVSNIPPKPPMDTSQRIFHVFGCTGSPMHVYSGFVLLRAGDIKKCPDCARPVVDITDTPLGQAYFAFTRPDLSARLP